jgi:hypothetical protein
MARPRAPALSAEAAGRHIHNGPSSMDGSIGSCLCVLHIELCLVRNKCRAYTHLPNTNTPAPRSAPNRRQRRVLLTTADQATCKRPATLHLCVLLPLHYTTFQVLAHPPSKAAVSGAPAACCVPLCPCTTTIIGCCSTYTDTLPKQCQAHLQLGVCLTAAVLEAPEERCHVLVGHLLLLMQLLRLLHNTARTYGEIEPSILARRLLGGQCQTQLAGVYWKREHSPDTWRSWCGVALLLLHAASARCPPLRSQLLHDLLCPTAAA